MPRVNGTYATMADSHVIVDGQRYDNINGLEMGEGWLVLSVYLFIDGKNKTVDQFLQPLLVAKSFAVKVGEDEAAPVLSAAYENMALVSRSYEVSQQPARREQAEDNRRAGTGCIWVCRLRYEDSRAIRSEALADGAPSGSSKAALTVGDIMGHGIHTMHVPSNTPIAYPAPPPYVVRQSQIEPGSTTMGDKKP